MVAVPGPLSLSNIVLDKRGPGTATITRGPHEIMVEICTNVRLLAYSTADNLRASSQIQTVFR